MVADRISLERPVVMSSASQPQFTPAQILHAGERAESEGHLDHARQYYAHLTDHYAHAPEGGMARERLARLAAAGRRLGPPPLPERAQRSRSDGAHRPPPRADAGARARPVRGGVGSGGGQTRLSVHLDAPHAERSWTRGDPRPKRRHRVGRWLARAVAIIGWLLLGLGVGVAVLAFTGDSIRLPGPALAPAPLAILAGAAIALGLMMVLVARLARAVFDGTEAMHDLLASGRGALEG